MVVVRKPCEIILFVSAIFYWFAVILVKYIYDLYDNPRYVYKYKMIKLG